MSSCDCSIFAVRMDSIAPVKNFSVMLGRVFLGWTITKQHLRTQYSDSTSCETPCANSESFIRGGPTFTTFFFYLFKFDWGEEWSKYNDERVIIGPPAKRNLNDVSLACRLWPNIDYWIECFTIFRESGPVLLKNNLYFCDFRWGSGPPVSPSECAHGL